MQIKLHKNARTTLALRQEIKNSNETVNALSKKFHLSWNTVNKWKQAETLEDKSSRPFNLNTTLTTEQEDLICFERKQFKKTIDDIYLCLENRIPNLYPMKVYRFANYEIVFFHIYPCCHLRSFAGHLSRFTRISTQINADNLHFVIHGIDV